MHFDDHGLDRLPRPERILVPLACPDCPQVVHGLSEQHAADLLAIHQEGTCQGGRRSQ